MGAGENVQAYLVRVHNDRLAQSQPITSEFNASLITFVNQQLNAASDNVRVELDKKRLGSWRDANGFPVKKFKAAVDDARAAHAHAAFHGQADGPFVPGNGN